MSRRVSAFRKNQAFVKKVVALKQAVTYHAEAESRFIGRIKVVMTEEGRAEALANAEYHRRRGAEAQAQIEALKAEGEMMRDFNNRHED